MMFVQDVLDWKGDQLVTCLCDALLSDVIVTLSRENIGTVMLTDEGGGLAGIVSERDIVRAVGQHGSDVVNARADSVMTRSLVTCTPGTSLADVLALMSVNEIRHLPVLCGGALTGLVSVRDVLDFQKVSLEADVARRQAEAADLQQAYDGLNKAFAERHRELQRAQRDADKANRSKTEFLTHMSHELRTPLNAIIGFSEVITTQAFGPVGNRQYCDYATDIHEAGQHLLALINDLLDLSKMVSGKAELHDESVDVADIARSAVKLLRARAEKQGVTIETEFQDDLPVLRANARNVRQILTNLLSNAVKFTDTGGTVALKLWCRTDSGYVVQVADTGIGMAPEDIPIALRAFEQIDRKHRREQEGTGLGLPLTKALVELHGGSLDLQSAPGVGTTVTARFPAARIDVQNPSGTAPQTAELLAD